MFSKNRACPFPYASHVCLTSKLITVRGHGDRVPIFKTHIGTLQVGEKLFRALTVVRSS